MANPPDFTWAQLYYPELLAALIRQKTQDWPEHTEENPHDPAIQLLRLFALIGHGHATRLDHVAREQYITTLRLRSSMIALARLVDYTLATASPAETDLVADVSGSISAGGSTLVKGHSAFATAAAAADQVVFEYAEDDDLEGSETGTWSAVIDDGGAQAAMAFPQALGVPAAGDDAYYFCHPDLMFNKLGLVVVGGTQAVTLLRWEYYDDQKIGQPSAAASLGAAVRLTVNDIVGTGRADGLQVIVTCLTTGVSETAEVHWGGVSNMVDTATSLGQGAVSTNAADYEVQTYWPELPDWSDLTFDTAAYLAVTGTVSWTLPQDALRRWTPTTINGVTGYFVRARPVVVTGVIAGSLDTPTEPSRTTWSTMFTGRQGQRVTDRLGTTDAGSATQTFTLARSPFLELVEITVDDEAWVRVDTFLSSASYDRHFTLIEQTDESWLLKFGDGTAGKIPGASVAVVAVYRIGGDVDGNLGAAQITRDRSGNAKIKNVRNPRAAEGWVAAEGSTAASLEAARTAIPASVRAGNRAVTPEDCETLVVAYRTADEAQLVTRALAVEEGLGPKTIQLLCVGLGGNALATADITELTEYFNGETVGLQRVGGVVMANTALTPESYTQHAIDVQVTVEVLEDYAATAESAIEAALQAILSPVAFRQVRNTDGVWEESTSYLWSWGRDDGSVKVTRALLIAAIATAVDGVVNITLALPAADEVLLGGELPVSGSLAVTVVSV